MRTHEPEPAMSAAHKEHRRHPRFALGLPVKLTVLGRANSMIVELMDLSATGGRFRAPPEEEGVPDKANDEIGVQESVKVNVNDRAAFGFVIPGQRHCVASGRVVRVRGAGEFALSLDRANEAFHGFLGVLSGKSPTP